ncbi:MAG TPA: hypothetical protein VG148_10485 [Pyrinomonadaceae bacterium]|nr:hypothetical protein [Pyrinomonadaceae bacterium]
MPLKTDRILNYLPGTFRALPKPTALHSVADAFGHELLLAENSLAAVMLSHWVDHADRGAEFIDDLARIAALYGLSPRPEEDVEEFREHLKRYVRTLLEGTMTVQGILRITAEALGLHIADDYAALDAWWTRADDALTRVEPRGDDAAALLFGAPAAEAGGEAARPAAFTGLVDLRGGVDLRPTPNLSVAVDGAPAVNVDFAARLGDLSSAKLPDIVKAINDALGARVASAGGGRLRLASTTLGPASRLEVGEAEGDAAPRLLGLLPKAYRGADATPASVTGLADLSGGADLTEARYLRLLVDGKLLAEVDCAAGSPGVKTLAQVAAAINAQFPAAIASHDGRFLRLTSPTTGQASSIVFERPAAQDAKEKLFGPVENFHLGRDARPAEVVGANDLGFGVDLSGRSLVRVQVDNQPAYTVDCAGEDPARTRPAEIAAALNNRLGAGVASHDARFVRLTSPTRGAAGSIRFEPLPPGEDATELIFGVRPRSFQGAPPRRARLVGRAVTASGPAGPRVNLSAVHLLRVSIDGGPPVEIDLREGVEDVRGATLDELRDAINRALGAEVASHDDERLTLASPTVGGASRVSVEPLTVTRRRRFVTRAFIMDEAALPVFGFFERRARGEGATRARLVGTADLSRGVDLGQARFIRLAVDGAEGVDVDCAGTRPRATLIGEVVRAVNDKFGFELAAATPDNKFVVLTSPTAGAGSRLAFEPPRAADASDALLGRGPGVFRGRDAAGIKFVGTVDLSGGVDLSAADKVVVAVDGQTREVSCAGADPAQTSLNEIVMAINVAFNAVVASREGARVALTSPTAGAGSRVEFPAQAEPNAVAAIFGVRPPRAYRGANALPARVAGLKSLQDGADLRVARFLRLAVNGATPLDIDCASRVGAGGDRSQVGLDDIVGAVNDALSGAGAPAAASHDGARLSITTNAAGGDERIELLSHTAGDAREKLFGRAEATQGSDPAPASVKGESDLLTPVNLSERRTLRIAVDGGRPTDVEVVGAAPATTFLDEIVAGINAVFPGLASATGDDRLLLTSPTRGEGSSVEVLPLRVLEVIEYPPEEAADPTAAMPPRAVRHGDRWFVANEGAADADLRVELSAPHGAVGPGLINMTTGARLRLTGIVHPGERAELWRDEAGGLRAEIVAADGSRRRVHPSGVLAGSAGPQVSVPFEGEWELSEGEAGPPATLELNDPTSHSVVILRARDAGGAPGRVGVRVTEAQTFGDESPHGTPEGSFEKLTGRVRAVADGLRLTDASGAETARLRAGAGVALEDYRDRVVVVAGLLYGGEGEPPPTLVVEKIAALFDVTLRREPGDAPDEPHRGVTVGPGVDARDELTRRINAGPQPSRFVRASEAAKADTLALPRGRTQWAYLDCFGTRFNSARFDESYFPGGVCAERAIFNVSRFTRHPPRHEVTVFAAGSPLFDAGDIADPPNLLFKLRGSRDAVSSHLRERFSPRLQQLVKDYDISGPPSAELLQTLTGELNKLLGGPSLFNEPRFAGVILRPETRSLIGQRPAGEDLLRLNRLLIEDAYPKEIAKSLAAAAGVIEPPTHVRFRWPQHRPGAFVVNLPADLPPRFGGRFNDTYFSRPGDAPEEFQDVVTEPAADPDFIVKRLAQSALVTAAPVASVPIGFEAVTMPFRRPRRLTGGNDARPARMYIAEKDVPGFIMVEARWPGARGNAVALAARKSGPARFDVTVSFEGARFESARRVVLGGEQLPALADDILRPSPVGLLQAKAAGVHVRVTRDRALPDD